MVKNLYNKSHAMFDIIIVMMLRSKPQFSKIAGALLCQN